MGRVSLHILFLLIATLLFTSCDKTPRGVMSKNKMADLIADLYMADAYIDHNGGDFESDSSRMVLKQSIFKKHGITQQDYDSSLVWYAHNMEDYIKAYDKAVGIIQKRYDKVNHNGAGNGVPSDLENTPEGISLPTHQARPSKSMPRLHKPKKDIKGDSADLWQGQRFYMLTQGAKRGFITFDLQPDANRKPGDRYQLAYKLTRGNNEFKVSLNVDYTDGATAQMTRGTNADGWVTIDLQSDSARQVRRIYGYVSYDMKRGHTAYVDSLSLMRTRMNKKNYGFIHGQRLFERDK